MGNGNFRSDPHLQRAAISRAARSLDRILMRRNDGWRSRSRTSEYPFLAAAVTAGWLRVDLTRLPIEACEKAQKGEPITHGKEGLEHARLKAAAIAWMRQYGASDVKAEVNLGPYRADCYSKDYDWVVECGNTDATRLNETLTWAEMTRFTVIPFQRQCWRGGKVRGLLAVNFYWPPSLTEKAIAHREAGMERAANALCFSHLTRGGDSSALPASAGRDAR